MWNSHHYTPLPRTLKLRPCSNILASCTKSDTAADMLQPSHCPHCTAIHPHYPKPRPTPTTPTPQNTHTIPTPSTTSAMAISAGRENVRRSHANSTRQAKGMMRSLAICGQQ